LEDILINVAPFEMLYQKRDNKYGHKEIWTAGMSENKMTSSKEIKMRKRVLEIALRYCVNQAYLFLTIISHVADPASNELRESTRSARRKK
jgi:hypothetical protein